jgi:hypothetical protein
MPRKYATLGMPRKSLFDPAIYKKLFRGRLVGVEKHTLRINRGRRVGVKQRGGVSRNSTSDVLFCATVTTVTASSDIVENGNESYL